jgi:hypothetical protein
LCGNHGGGAEGGLAWLVWATHASQWVSLRKHFPKKKGQKKSNMLRIIGKNFHQGSIVNLLSFQCHQLCFLKNFLFGGQS